MCVPERKTYSDHPDWSPSQVRSLSRAQAGERKDYSRQELQFFQTVNLLVGLGLHDDTAVAVEKEDFFQGVG